MQEQNDSLKVSVLASGSTGNCTYIETAEHKILIDAGLSGKKIENLMQSIGRDLSDVDSLFVTHEHSDHRKGVGVLARRYGMDVYANQGTWDAMASKIGKIPTEQKNIIAPDSVLSIGDLDIRASQCLTMLLNAILCRSQRWRSFVVLTDTGYVSDHVEVLSKMRTLT